MLVLQLVCVITSLRPAFAILELDSTVLFFAVGGCSYLQLLTFFTAGPRRLVSKREYNTTKRNDARVTIPRIEGEDGSAQKLVC